MVKRIGKTTIRQKSPIESEREKPRMAQEKSCCLKKKVPGITSDEAPKHSPKPSPKASHPAVTAAALMNVATVQNSTGLEVTARDK